MKSFLESLVGSEVLQPLLGLLAVLSLATFILSLVLIPWIVGMLPQDCFLKLYHTPKRTKSRTICSVIWSIFRNIIGLSLFSAGVLMLFLPGQGLITILLGLLLISFPGKQKLVHILVRQPKIQVGMDWLRTKRGKKTFLWPQS